MGVNVMLVIALAYALAKLTILLWLGPARPLVDAPESARSADVDQPAATRPGDAAVIASWHLFGQVAAEQRAEAPPPALPMTPLNLRLVGIFFMERGGDRALALIAESNGPERGYRAGEALPGNARLQRIQRDHVVVSRDGREEVLNLPKLGDSASNPALPDAPAPAMPHTPMEAPPPSPEPEPAPVPRQSRVIDASLVAKRLRGEALARPHALEDIAFVSPHVQNGQFVGFRLRPGRDRELFQQLGLSGGDVVTEVNGTRLNSPVQGLTMVRELLNARQIAVRVLRDGAEFPLTFSLEGSSAHEQN